MTTPESLLGLRSVLGRPPGRETTRADHVDFLEAGLTPLACGHCGAVVRVKKNSPKHTSIQWTTDASSCPVYAAAGVSSARADTCERLAESIRAAARAGELEVPGAG